ncbi:MAG TPA: phosphotransferase, partial [Emcibacteraceae bacterium]|nr:phosphotransferase [Emcibacteraceae bacterium]
MQRSEKIRLFLKDIGWKGAEVTPLAGDASFRRYDRVVLNGQKAVLMDAPPEFEDTRPFVAVASYLRDLGLAAPKILARDFEEGFLLLEDLGDNLFKTVLEKDPLQELTLYKKAVDELVLINRFDPPSELPYGEGKYTLPHYDMDLLLNEIFLFSDWYYPALTGKRMPFKKRQEYAELWKNVLAKVSTAKECLVLRDYHAENLLSLENGKIGMLDFQDAVIGHAAYDLVSLLQDARRDVDSDTEEKMVDYMADKLGRDKQIFKEHYAILGAQRDTKIIGIFARLFLRDGKDIYLKLIPRMWGLLERCFEHPVLEDIKIWMDREVPEKRNSPFKPQRLGPDHAMILAAGLGKRMRPLTDNIPKPLIKIADKTLLAYSLDALAAAGIKYAVVNKHHYAEQIDQFIAERKDW